MPKGKSPGHPSSQKSTYNIAKRTNTLPRPVLQGPGKTLAQAESRARDAKAGSAPVYKTPAKMKEMMKRATPLRSAPVRQTRSGPNPGAKRK